MFSTTMCYRHAPYPPGKAPYFHNAPLLMLWILNNRLSYSHDKQLTSMGCRAVNAPVSNDFYCEAMALHCAGCPQAETTVVTILIFVKYCIPFKGCWSKRLSPVLVVFSRYVHLYAAGVRRPRPTRIRRGQLWPQQRP